MRKLEIIDYYKPHNEKLYNLIDKKFDWDKLNRFNKISIMNFLKNTLKFNYSENNKNSVLFSFSSNCMWIRINSDNHLCYV